MEWYDVGLSVEAQRRLYEVSWAIAGKLRAEMGTPGRDSSVARPTVGGKLDPMGRSFLFVWVLLALSLGTGAAAFRTFHRFETGIGQLQAKSRGVYSRREARIAEILVHQGQVVEPGTPIVLLQDVQLERQIRGLQHQVSIQQAQLDERKAQAEVELQNRKQELDAKIFDVQLQRASFQRAKPVEAEKVGGGNSPKVRGTVGLRTVGLEVDPATASASEAVKFDPQVRLCDDRLARLQQELVKLPEEIRVACGVKTAEARLKQLEQDLGDLEQEQKTLTLQAEVHGTVGVLQVQVGDLVVPRQQIVSLMDEDQPYLVVKVPSEKLSDYAPGTPLRIVFPGKIEMDGVVEVIPPQAESTVKSAEGQGNNSAQIAVVVVPSGAEWPRIPFGATVDVQRFH